MNYFKLCLTLLALAVAAVTLAGCNYGLLLRPKVLAQLNPEMVNLINELPNVDNPNEQIVERLFVHGGLDHAKLGGDGIYRARIGIPDGQLIWKPAIIVMPRGGELQLDFDNTDAFTHHAALLPNNGNPVALEFAPGEHGHARIRLDGPGLYWFGCPVANHAGRGMLGLIIVGGKCPMRPSWTGRNRIDLKGVRGKGAAGLPGSPAPTTRS